MDQKEFALTLSEYVGKHNVRGVVFQGNSVTVYHNSDGVPADVRNEITGKLSGISVVFRQRKYRGGRPLPKTFKVRHR